jgi:hypothetical protein
MVPGGALALYPKEQSAFFLSVPLPIAASAIGKTSPKM